MATKKSKKNSLGQITEAFNNNTDSDRMGNHKTIDVRSATWQWDDDDEPIEFGSGFAYHIEVPQYNDLKVCCPAIHDSKGGTSSEFNLNFQDFSYDRDTNSLTIRGEKEGRNYVVCLTFG